MNKKNSLLVIIGVFMIFTRFWIAIGSFHIDISNDIVAYALILAGMYRLKGLNSRFKKAMIVAVVGFLGALISQYFISRDWPQSPETMYSAAIGISVVFAIYFSYYYTEGLIMEARVQEKIAVTRNYQITWTLLSAALFIHYFTFKSTVSMASILVEALIVLLSLYYCSLVFTNGRQLYED